MKLLSLQVGLPRDVGSTEAAEPVDRLWHSGIWKEPVTGAVSLGTTNLAGDGQADLRVHGGPDKAVCVYPAEHYPHWRAELGLAFGPGAFGENFTTDGLSEASIFIGDIFRLAGGVVVQVTQPREPCWKLARRWRVMDLPVRVTRTGFTGWYFRVLETGAVEAGEAFTLEQRVQSRWSIAAANEVMHHRAADAEATVELAGCEGLSTIWREALTQRAASRTPGGLGA